MMTADEVIAILERRFAGYHLRIRVKSKISPSLKNCPRCGGVEVIRAGAHRVAENHIRQDPRIAYDNGLDMRVRSYQRYLCHDCGRSFVDGNYIGAEANQ